MRLEDMHEYANAAGKAWPAMATGQREGEPERKGAAWLAWFCRMVYQWAWFVPAGDGKLAVEVSHSLSLMDSDIRNYRRRERVLLGLPESADALDHLAEIARLRHDYVALRDAMAWIDTRATQMNVETLRDMARDALRKAPYRAALAEAKPAREGNDG